MSGSDRRALRSRTGPAIAVAATLLVAVACTDDDSADSSTTMPADEPERSQEAGGESGPVSGAGALIDPQPPAGVEPWRPPTTLVPPPREHDLPALDIALVGVESSAGTSRFTVADPDGIAFGDGEAVGAIDVVPGDAEYGRSIVANDVLVGRELLTADGVLTAIDVNPGVDGFELVWLAPWASDDGPAPSDVVVATVSGWHVHDRLDAGVTSVLCRLPGSGRPAQPDTELVAVVECDGQSTAVRAFRAVPLPDGRCPRDEADLIDRIDRLEEESRRRLDKTFRDFEELLSDREYWQKVIRDHLAAVGLPTSDDPVEFLKWAAGEAGLNGVLEKAMLNAYRTEGTRGALGQYLASKGVFVDVLVDGYDQARQLYNPLSKTAEGLRKYAHLGATDEAAATVAGDLQQALLEQILADTKPARERLERSQWQELTGRGEPTPADVAAAFERYRRARNLLVSHTGGFNHPEPISALCPEDFGRSDDDEGLLDGLLAWMAGDPHIRTFDGFGYAFQAAGEFVYVASDDGDMEVHTRLTPVGPRRNATYASVVGIRALDHRLSASFVERNLVVIDGEPIETSPGERRKLEGGVWVDSRADRLAIRWPDGSTVTIKWLNTLSVDVAINPVRAGAVRGLAGNGDGLLAGELTTPSGPMPDGAEFTSWLYTDFADAWRVDDATSLLPYGPGESTSDFTDRSVPNGVADFGDFAASEIDASLRICLGEGVIVEPWLTNCVYDVTISGNSDFAADARAAMADSVDEFEIVTPPGSVVALLPHMLGPGAAELRPDRPIDVYRFLADADDEFWFEPIREGWLPEQGCGIGPPFRPVHVQVFGPDGEPVTSRIEIANNCSYVGFGFEPVLSGEHSLVVGGIGLGEWNAVAATTRWPYGVTLTLLDPPDEFVVALGETVGPGTHGPGSGQIPTAGAADRLTVDLDAGSLVGVRPISFDGACAIGPGPGVSVTISHEGQYVADLDGRPIVDSYIANNCAYATEGALAQFRVPVSGEYVVEVAGRYALSRPRHAAYEVAVVEVSPSAAD